MGASGIWYTQLGYMGAKDFDGFDERLMDELRERLS